MIYKCPKVIVPPTIDGILDDDAWKQTSTITLVRSETGEAAVKTTEAKMCWDNHNLYIAFQCADEDIYGNYLQRDDPIYAEDVVEAFLCPGSTLTRYFEFEVSPRNVQFDAVVTTEDEQGNGMAVDVSWDCKGFKTAVVVDGTLDDRTDIDRQWTVEMSIPFASLGVKAPRARDNWRGNLYRIDRSPEPVEHQAWSPTLRDPAAFHVPNRFGSIEFVES